MPESQELVIPLGAPHGLHSLGNLASAYQVLRCQIQASASRPRDRTSVGGGMDSVVHSVVPARRNNSVRKGGRHRRQQGRLQPECPFPAPTGPMEPFAL